ncbi:class I SAM-dependent methyltransferase [Roseibium sp. MMSF_3544]|uniref:class I SAM-dependent DNA methyltransferase n=1 Tax=unclassified Roseibium TaxID=2629323 RepID=UPI00273D8831|nr:class I SAM-dependent methyltransferase [Roseibium sp. MMSF_3544]
MIETDYFILKEAHSLGADADAIREFYTDWAKTYDTDLLMAIGYAGHEAAAEALCERISDTALVLDVGCGTGLVGLEIMKRKFDVEIDGIDLTPEMLKHARKKGAYRTLNVADLFTVLDEIEDDKYDGVVCVGIFSHGHVGPGGLNELIRIAKPGAPIVFAVLEASFEADGFNEKIETLETEGKTKTLDVSLIAFYPKQEVFCQLVVLEVI